LKSFIKKRLTIKSRDNKSDFTSGHASKPYINEGKHLLDNKTVTQHLYLLLYRLFQKSTHMFSANLTTPTCVSAAIPIIPTFQRIRTIILITHYSNLPTFFNVSRTNDTLFGRPVNRTKMLIIRQLLRKCLILLKVAK